MLNKLHSKVGVVDQNTSSDWGTLLAARVSMCAFFPNVVISTLDPPLEKVLHKKGGMVSN